MDLILLADDIVRGGIKSGCDAAEVYIKSSHGITVEVKDRKVDTLKASRDFVIAVRVIKRKRLGFSFTTDIEKIEKTINEAVEAADWTADDIYNDIPDLRPPSDVAVFDKDIIMIREEDVIKDALLLEESALSYDSRVKKVRKAMVSVGTGKTVIVNSKGVNISYDSSYISAHIIALAEDGGGDSQTGWDFALSRRRQDVDLTTVGINASRRAIELLGSRRITSVKIPVILDSSVAVEFLDILGASLSAEAVQKKKSLLAGKIGNAVVSPVLDIIDDGTIPWCAGTRPVDDEGTPTSKKALISNGILQGYIHNTYTAKKANVDSTGNAVRASSKSLPGVGMTNFYIRPKEEGQVEIGFRDNGLLKSLNRGILITDAMGVHTANPVSGDFSLGISGLWIEGGEPVYPVKEAVISGNILELFKRVEEVGRDLKFYGGSGSSSLLIGRMDISA